MATTLLLVTSLLLPAQESAQDPGATPPVAEEPAPAKPDVNAAALQGRIHEMRKNLLTGGPRVREAEAEAVDFYGGKVELVEQRLDTIRAELTEKRATYDLALDRTLTAKSADSRRAAMGEASRMRTEISALESEAATLASKRGDLNKMIGAVQARERDRERLITQMETSDDFELMLDIPLAGVGLAPSIPAAEAASPLDDSAFVADLIARDPRTARSILYEADPQGYWKRFPLKPPTSLMSQTLEFPLPDLPGQR